MKYFATTWMFVATLLLTVPFGVQAQHTHDTGSVSTDVYDDGFIGTDPTFVGTGFCFEAEACTNLFVGTALVGIGGSADTQPYSGASEFAVVAPGAAVVPGPPYDAHFDDGWATTFSSPLGVTLHQTSYSATGSGDQFIVFDLCAENTSGGDLDVFLGYFADWDVGDFLSNQGDASGNLVYTWDDSGTSTAYYGFAPIDDGVSLSGWNVSSATTDDGQYTEMTTPGAPSGAPDDRRNVMGVDAGTVADGETVCRNFAWAAGVDLADLEGAIDAAASTIIVAIEPGPDGTPGTHNLSAVYPNPFNPQANFTLEVAEQQNVRVALIDALGRVVATLHNGTLSAGQAHAFQIDGSGLPSGVYLVRATGEHFADVQQVTLMK